MRIGKSFVWVAITAVISTVSGCGDEPLPWEPETPVCLTSPHCEGDFSVHEDAYYGIHTRHDCTAPHCREGVVTTCTGCSGGGCTGCETTTCASPVCNATFDACAEVAPESGAAAADPADVVAPRAADR